MPTSIELREFEKSDYEALTEILNTLYPEYRQSVEEFRYADENFDTSKYIFKRYVAVEPKGARVVAFGEYSHTPGMFHPQKFWLGVYVHPDWQRQGIGSMLYERLLEDLQKLSAILLWANAREDKTDSVAFLHKRGFREKMRSWESRLYVPSFDSSKFADHAEKAQKITITTLAEERAKDPDCLKKLYELYTLIMADVPHPDTYTPVPFEHFLRYIIEHPDALPQAYFIAKDGGLYVGQSNLFCSQAEPKDLYQGLTGVRREYRGRGIAMALKLKVIEYAQKHGYEVIKTWNESGNVGILAINQKLGFVRQPAWITFVKGL